MRKLTKFLSTSGLVLALAGSALTLASVEDEIKERIAPEGSVRVAGESAEQADESARSDRSGEDVYAAACGSCHDSGAAGAPRLGKSGDWTDRLEQDTETLYDHAINGYNAMPAKGGCSDCSDGEVEKAVDYMVSESE